MLSFTRHEIKDRRNGSFRELRRQLFLVASLNTAFRKRESDYFKIEHTQSEGKQLARNPTTISSSYNLEVMRRRNTDRYNTAMSLHVEYHTRLGGVALPGYIAQEVYGSETEEEAIDEAGDCTIENSTVFDYDTKSGVLSADISRNYYDEDEDEPIHHACSGDICTLYTPNDLVASDTTASNPEAHPLVAERSSHETLELQLSLLDDECTGMQMTASIEQEYHLAAAIATTKKIYSEILNTFTR